MFGGAGMFGLYALGALTACVILLLSTAMTGWVAALIIAAVYVIANLTADILTILVSPRLRTGLR